MQPLKVFYSYAHEDRDLCQELKKYLIPLARAGRITDWYDRMISPGTDWAKQIDDYLNSAQIIVLLISADFLASDYCWGVEMKRAIERHEKGEARVVPVILRHCDWQDAPFSKLQCLPDGATPVIDWPIQDKAFVSVVEGIKKVAMELQQIEQEGEQQHRVRIARDFAIGKHEVTFSQYDRFCEATGRKKPSDWNWGRGNRPVINVSWEDAVAYAEWLSKQTEQTYRLPTEAEWEYAARAGTTTAYWWGDNLGRNRANCDGCGSRWDNKETAPVGSFPANPFGLHDTAGNVWEWTCSAYDENYGGKEQECISKNRANSVRLVLRGGSCFTVPRRVRSAYRLGYAPGYRIYGVGFRLARSF